MYDYNFVLRMVLILIEDEKNDRTHSLEMRCIAVETMVFPWIVFLHVRFHYLDNQLDFDWQSAWFSHFVESIQPSLSITNESQIYFGEN